MPINFPDSPTTGDTHTVGDKTWTFDGTAWNVVQNNVSDHGNLDGLADDDHTQYLLADGTRSATGIITATGFSGPLTGDVSGNAATADALSTPRTVSLTGNVTGSTSFDGSSDVSISSTIANNSVSNAMLRDSSGLSVIGRSSSTTGDPADISAGTDGHVLRRSGTSLSFGQIVAAGIANSTITKSKMAAGTLEVLQVVRSSYGQMLTASTGFVNTGLSASITPTSSSNKIGVFIYLNIYDSANSNNTVYVRTLRSGTVILSDYVAQANLPSNSTSGLTLLVYDAPATTSSRTYTLQARSDTGALIGAPLNSGEIWLFEFAM